MIRISGVIGLAVFFAVTLLLGGCAGNPQVAADEVSDGVALTSTTSAAKSDESACSALAQEMTENNRRSLFNRVNVNYISAQVLDGFSSNKMTPDNELKFKSMINALLRSMIVFRGDSVRWDVLHWSKDSDRLNCTIRTNLSEGGISYIEFEMRKSQGELKIVDWYDLVQQIRVTDMIGELVSDIYEMASLGTSFISKQSGKAPKESVAYYNYITSIKSLNQKSILAAYDGLPERFKSKPLYTLIGLRAASTMNADALRYILLREFDNRFGADERYGLMLSDLYFEDEEYGKVERGVLSFKQQVGNDPLLELLLAELEKLRGNKEAFYKHCLQAIDDDPNYIDTYWVLLDQFVTDRRYDDAVAVLNVLSNTFGYELDKQAFYSDDKYSDFVKSDEFKTWNVEKT